MKKRTLLVVFYFSYLALSCGNASAQTGCPSSSPSCVDVLSHTDIENGQLVAVCKTVMKDQLTPQNYLAAVAFCSLSEKSQSASTATIIESWNCSGRTSAVCSGPVVNGVDAGATYETDGDHGLTLVVDAGCPDCFFDPLGYVVPPALIPTFQDSGTVSAGRGNGLPVTPLEFPNDPNFRIARTAETPFVSILVTPSGTNVKANDTVTFVADRAAQWTFTGAGTVDPPLLATQVVYHAPTSIAIDKVDQLIACDLNQSHGQNCATIHIGLHPLSVVVVGLPELFPSQEGPLQPDYVARVSSFNIPVNTGLNWSESDTSGVSPSLVTMSSSSTSARLQVASTSLVKFPFDITLQACAQLDISQCGTLVIHVPVSRVTIPTDPTGADFSLDSQTGTKTFVANATLTFQADVTGPVISTDMKPRWGFVPGTELGTIITDPASDFRGLYTPPSPPITSDVTVIVKACIGGAQNPTVLTVFKDEICGFYPLSLAPPSKVTSPILSVNSGESIPVTITGTGFGAAPAISFADPSISLKISTITGPDASGVTTVTGTLTIAPIPATEVTTLTVTSSLPPPTGAGSQSMRVHGVNLTPTVTPTTASLVLSQSQQFTPNLGCQTFGGNPCTVPQTSTCSLISGPGVMSASCLYTAPASLTTQTQIQAQACFTFGNVCQTFSITVAPPDFALSTPQSTALSSPGFQTNINLNVTCTGGFTGNVTLSATLPTGIGMSSQFSPATVPCSGNSIIIFPVTSSTPVGNYPITITGTSGGLVHTIQATVSVAQPSLSLTVSPPQTVAAGQTVTYTYTDSWTGFFGAVTVNVTGVPPGSTVIPEPFDSFMPGTFTFAFTTPATLTPGNYNLTFTATGNGLVTVGTTSLNVTLIKAASTTLTIPAPPPPPPPPKCRPPMPCE